MLLTVSSFKTILSRFDSAQLLPIIAWKSLDEFTNVSFFTCSKAVYSSTLRSTVLVNLDGEITLRADHDISPLISRHSSSSERHHYTGNCCGWLWLVVVVAGCWLLV